MNPSQIKSTKDIVMKSVACSPRTVSSWAVAASFAALAGCYTAAPPAAPHVPLPRTVNGASIDVSSVSKTTLEQVEKTARTCAQNNAADCVETHYSVTEPVTRTKTKATYAGEPINYAQFLVMTNPNYDKQATELDDLTHKCHRANLPRYLGIGLIIGGFVADAIVKRTPGEILAFGGAAAGITSYALGYYTFGGRDCNRANELAQHVDMSNQMPKMVVDGNEEADEMKTLAEKFNAENAVARAPRREPPPQALPSAKASKRPKKPSALRMR